MIEGRSVRLRPVEREDLPRFVRWLADPEVRRHIEMHLSLSLAQEERWFEESLGKGDLQPLAIDARLDGDFVHVGSCGFHEIRWRDRTGVVGLLIGERTVWGRGLGTEAMRALLRHAFDTLNLNRIALRVFENNVRAVRVYEKLGFVREGRLRQDHYREGRYVDVLVMGLLREEWRPDDA
jgi:RimJ/RimL family protein N-acetyltransferase